MRLLPLPDASGQPILWINADHLASVQPVYRTGTSGVVVDAELKIDGLPLHRVPLGEHTNRDAAAAAFGRFLDQLQSD